MPFLSAQEMAIGDGNGGNTVKAGSSANVVLTKFDPFQYGANKEKTMPKYFAKDADTGETYEFVGFKFHDCVKELNDRIGEDTVVHVKCLDNGTKYPDYELTVASLGAKKEDAPF